MSRSGNDGPLGTSTFVLESRPAAAQPPPERRCHPQFCFTDADVILVSGDTEFRLHKYQLSRSSPKFRAMLEGRTGTTTNPIRLHLGHPVNDFAKFLRMLYDNLTVNEYLKPDLQLVRLMVRLSKHYQVKHYEQLALTHLNRLAPSGILDWLDYNDPTILKRLQASGNVACLSDFKWERDCVTVANLARELGLPRLFNTALYHYAQLPPQYFIFGIDLRKKLFRPDRVACFEGRDKLRTADGTLFHAMFARVPVPHCETEAVCELARQQSESAIASSQANDWMTTRPITGRQDEWLRHRELSLCAACTASVEGELAFGRQKILDNLATYFERSGQATFHRTEEE